MAPDMVTGRRINQLHDAGGDSGAAQVHSAPILLIRKAKQRGPPKTNDSGCRYRESRDESGSAVNPNLRARPGAVRPALRKCRSSRRFVFEALFAGAGLRPAAVCPL